MKRLSFDISYPKPISYSIIYMYIYYRLYLQIQPGLHIQPIQTLTTRSISFIKLVPSILSLLLNCTLFIFSQSQVTCLFCHLTWKRKIFLVLYIIHILIYTIYYIYHTHIIIYIIIYIYVYIYIYILILELYNTYIVNKPLAQDRNM